MCLDSFLPPMGGGTKLIPPTRTLEIVMQTLPWVPYQDWMKMCSFQYNFDTESHTDCAGCVSGFRREGAWASVCLS